MTDAQDRIADIVKSNEVVLFMKGTELFPQCGFSSRAVAILNHLGASFETVDVLQDQEIRQGIKQYQRVADHPAALCEGRVRWRVRHHDGDVRKRRASAADRRAAGKRGLKTLRGGSTGTREPYRTAPLLAWNQVDAQYVAMGVPIDRNARFLRVSRSSKRGPGDCVRNSDTIGGLPALAAKVSGKRKVSSSQGSKLFCDITQSWSEVGGGVRTYLLHKRRHILQSTPGPPPDDHPGGEG